MKKLLPAFIAVLLLICGIPALADTDLPEETPEQVSSLFGEMLSPVQEALSSERTEENAVYEVSVDAASGKAVLRYSVAKEAKAELRIYNDYEDESERQLLFTLGPVALDPEGESVTLDIPKGKLPEYFMAEAVTTTAGGETNTLSVTHYSEALTFARNANAADFKEGYYVAIGTDDPDSRPGPHLLSANGSVGTGDQNTEVGTATTGYVAYNEDLILLDPDTEYKQDGNSIVLSPVPEALAGMTEEELANVKGFVIRGTGSLDNDVFILNDGVELGRNSLTIKTREPESLDELYSSVDLNLKGVSVLIPFEINEKHLKGKLYSGPTADAKITLHGWKIELTVTLGLESKFDLDFSRTFSWSDPSYMWATPPSGIESANTHLPSIGFHYYGFGVRFETQLKFAANEAAHASGEFGMNISVSASLSGCSVHCDDWFKYDTVEPKTPNRATYIYLSYNYIAHVEGFYFDFKIFEIGPVIDLRITEEIGGRALATLYKDVEQAVGDDVLHECTGIGRTGCISGEMGHRLIFSGKLEIDVFFKSVSFKLFEKRNVPEDSTDLDYFYHSLFYNEEETRHGKVIYCPHELYRFSVRVTQNRYDDIKDALISGDEIETDVSTLKTDVMGKANPIYMPVESAISGSPSVKADYPTGGMIGEAPVTSADLLRHREIKIDTNARVINTVTVYGEYPTDPGDKMHVGKSVTTTEPAHYYPYIAYKEGSVPYQTADCYGTAMSVRWNDEMPDKETQVIAKEGVNRCVITMDFSTYDGGDWTIDPNVTLWLTGPFYGDYQYLITGYQISDKETTDPKTGEVLSIQPACILTIEAEFITKTDTKYVVVNVKEGLNSVSSHYYKVGSTAIAVARDVESVRQATLELVPYLSLEDWSAGEKEALKDEIHAAGPSEEPFDRWSVNTSGGHLNWPDDFYPAMSADGVISYNTVAFTVPDCDRVDLYALYATYSGIEKVDALVKEPIPGQSFSDEGYAFGTLTAEPVEDSVQGVYGEEPQRVKLSWYLDENEALGKIRYNTTYTVKADVVPRNNDLGKYHFLFPLDSAKGTKAYFTPEDEFSKREEQEPALTFEPVYEEVPSMLPDESLPVVNLRYAEMTWSFTTKKALLLEVLPTDDLWFPEGITPEAVNAVLRNLGVNIVTEDEFTNDSDADWEELYEVPGPGESLVVNGILWLPDNIRNEDVPPDHKKVDESTTVTIHIYGADELDPPTASPEAGVYRKDVNVRLSHKDEAATIYYRIAGETEFAPFDKANPIALKRDANTTKTYTIEAYAEKDGVTSPTVPFTYILQPAEGEYQLTMIGGSASSESGSGTGTMFVKAGVPVTIEPLEYENLVFDHWNYSVTPEFVVEPDKTTGIGSFIMPNEDITVTGIFYPINGARTITEIILQADYIHLGQAFEDLPQTDISTAFGLNTRGKVTDPDARDDPSISDTLTRFDKVTTLNWDPNADYPVTYGTYVFNADYTIEKLVDLSKKMASRQRITNDTVFAPFVKGKFHNEPLEVIVSNDGKSAKIAYSYTFEPSYFTVKYDVNGGEYGEVPRQVVQLKNNVTPLTEAEPYRQDGSKFLGWATTPDAAEPQYIYSEDTPVEFTEDTTLYAVWAPYTVEVRWLDNNNAKGTRSAFDVTMEDGTVIHVDPADAKTKNGVGIETYSVKLADFREHIPTIDGLDEDGYITFPSAGGSENIYEVVSANEPGKTVITLLAKRKLTADKSWDIDLENNDKPKSINVILQSTKKPQEDPLRLLKLVISYVQDGSTEDRDAIIKEIEKITGYSLKGLTPEAAGSKVMHMIASGTLSVDNLTDALKKLLTADTDNSTVDGTNWYAYQKISLGSDNSWKNAFKPVDRFDGTFTVKEDGSISASWKGEMKYRVVEKAGKAPVENGKDAVYTVPAYTNIAGKRVDEHKTVYVAKYKTSGDNTSITNTAVEDHYIDKEWVLFGTAKKPENVYAVLLWQYDSEYLSKASELLGIDMPQLWLPEENPISGDKISVGDLLDSIGLPIPFADKIKIPLAIAKLNEKNDWRAHFRVRKYGNLGLPLEHEASEFFSAICQDIVKYFLGIDLHIGINPLQKFISVSVPEIPVPLTTDLFDGIVNTWAGGDDDDDKPNKIGGAKSWNDNNNADGIRPKSIHLTIWEDDLFYVDEIDVTPGIFDSKNHWTWTYKSDSINTKKHSYSVTEDPVEGYTSKVSGLNVTNTHKSVVEKTVDLHVVKSWNEEAVLTHEPLQVTVLRNGEAFQTVTLSADNSWTADFKGLDMYDGNGNDYSFSIEEPVVPEGYTVGYEVAKATKDGKVIWNLYVTNTPVSPEKISIKGKKIWDDNGDKLHRRPESVTVRLLADGEEIEAIVLSEENAWSWSREVDEYTAEGTKIVYTITEDALSDPDYTTTIDGLNVTNRLDVPPVPDTWTVDIEKIWQGDDSVFVKEPVTVTLMRNGEDLESFTLDENGSWKAETAGLSMLDENGRAYTYSVREETVPTGFTVSYSSKTDAANNRISFKVINKHTPGSDEISGTKIWVDDNDHDRIRPDSITLRIFENGREEVASFTVKRSDNLATDGSNYWTWSYAGSEINTDIAKYVISEDSVPGYSTKYTGYDITNTHKSKREETVSVTVKKTWLDTGDVDHDPLAITLLRNGKDLTTVTLSAENNWSVTLDKFEKYDADGYAYRYSIEERQVPEGYSASYNVTCDGNGNFTCVVTNTPDEPVKTVIRGRKIWDDENDKQGLRPASVTVRLFADGAELASYVLSESNGWAWSREVYKYDTTGSEIKYTVTEDPLTGTKYTTTIDGLNVTNKLDPVTPPDPDQVTVAVRKVWKGLDETHTEVPVTVYMTANGEVSGDPVTLSDENDWRHTFGTFPKKDESGKTIEYSVKEEPVPDGCVVDYTCSYNTRSATFSWTVTNTYTSETPIGGRKIWEDDDDAAGCRPSSVHFIILANGQAVDRKVLNAATNWEWSGVYPKKDEKGKAIKYEVREEPVRYYTGIVSEDGLSVINVILPTKVVISKTWVDENNRYGRRPESISVIISCAPEGSETYKELKTVTLTGDPYAANWKESFSVPLFDDAGQVLKYRIEETVDASPYKVTYDDAYYDDATNEWRFHMTNTLSGPLYITNNVVHGDPDRLFTFDVTLENTAGAPFTGTLEARFARSDGRETIDLDFTNGTASIELAGNEYVSIEEIPVGWRYTVKERVPYSYRVWVIDKDNEVKAGKATLSIPEKNLMAAAAPVDDYPTYTTAKKNGNENRADFYNEAGFTVVGKKTIDGKKADASVEGLFSFELLDDSMTPVIDEDGTPVTAVNRADGTFELTAHIELAGPATFYVREIDDSALTDDYILDTAPHAVSVDVTPEWKTEQSPKPVTINNVTLTSLTVYKVWAGGDKGAIDLELRANGTPEPGYTAERSGNTYVFKGLPKTNEKGKPITWSAVESVPDGYVASYSNVAPYAKKTDAAYDGGTILNRPTTEISIKKVWLNIAVPPKSITLRVYRNGKLYSTVKKSPAADGTIKFRLPKYGVDEIDYEYSFTEVPIPNYKTTYENVGDYSDVTDRVYNGGTITNEHGDFPPPRTGDENRPVFFAALALISLLGLAGTCLARRKNG